MLWRLSAIATLGVLVLAINSARADDQEKFQGVWKAEKVVAGGMEMPAEEVSKLTIEFKGNKAMPRHDGQTEKEGEFTLDGSKNPKNIDIKTPEGKTALGIYEFDGDNLKICVIKDGGERPTKLESPAGSKNMYIVLKKQAK